MKPATNQPLPSLPPATAVGFTFWATTAPPAHTWLHQDTLTEHPDGYAIHSVPSPPTSIDGAVDGSAPGSVSGWTWPAGVIVPMPAAASRPSQQVVPFSA